jgi:hypothetical protein
MANVFTLREGPRRGWLLRRRGRCWSFEKWTFRATGESIRSYPLDYDARHNRLFLRERDERAVGVAGVAALERMARRALGARG